jgi:hypothetical protein
MVGNGRLNFFMRQWSSGYSVEMSRQDGGCRASMFRVAGCVFWSGKFGGVAGVGGYRQLAALKNFLFYEVGNGSRGLMWGAGGF